APAEPEPAPEAPRSESAFSTPAPEQPAAPAPGGYDPLVGESAAASAASAFAGLASSLRQPAADAGVQAASDLTFASGSTVEALVAEMLRPMLKAWLDANLPGIVEREVRREVERIARSAG